MNRTTSDEALIGQARLGDQAAFGELWRRHYRSGARVARQFTSIDADDLVAEAYTRIYQRVLSGGGPTGAFRPYLYTTIRNLAATWGAAARDVQVDDIDDFEDLTTVDDPAVRALDRTLTARAFRSLPERWQTVLWYTEVEGMDPHEVAPLLGLTANSVAALSYRAREGLRRAWLQAHVSDDAAPEECRFTVSRLGDYARSGLGERDRKRVDLHLLGCTRCAILVEEVDEVGSRLALVMIPLLLGGTAGGTLLASLGEGAAVAAHAAIPAVPASFAALQSTAAPVVAGLSMGASTGATVLVASIAVVAALGGATTVAFVPFEQGARSGESQSQEPPPESGAGPTLPPTPTSPPGVVSEAVDAVDEALAEVVDTVTSLPVDFSVELSGDGTPGATVSATADGVVYATTTVDANGNWSLTAAGIPGATESLQLSQQLVVLGIAVPLDVALTIDGGTDGITVQLLN